VLATAGGLVFQGTGDRRFHAYRAQSGERLWSFDVQSGIVAPPVSYEVGGEQYVTVLAGWGGAFGLMSGIKPPPGPKRGRVLSFKLGATATLPPVPPPDPIPDPPPRLDVAPEVVERGSALYSNYCAFCHGAAAISGGTLPDLRRLGAAKYEALDGIVRMGAFQGRGMPGFGDVLSEDDVQAIRAYLVDEANEDEALRNTPAWWAAIRRAGYEVFAWIASWFLELSSPSA
jgi:quinohemoprotein ethanol dehydrogenase